MRFPSIDTAVRQARATLVRFPLSILSGLTGMVVLMRMTDSHNQPWEPRLLTTAVLGLALFTATVTTAERRGIAKGARWAADLVILLGLALVFRASIGWSDQMAPLRFAQLLLIAHLLVAVGPFAFGRREADNRLGGFWQFNRFLFLRYLVAGFYAAVLFVGLAVAIGALDKLFEMKIAMDTYFRLWAFMALGFHPWFFLAGVPRDFAELDTLDDYPLGLKVFTQFVLMPLVGRLIGKIDVRWMIAFGFALLGLSTLHMAHNLYPGIDLPHVCDAWQILSGRVLPKNNVVIIGGGLIGMETADFMSRAGAQVTIVEVLKRSPVLKITSHGYMLHTRLREAKCKFLFDTTVKRIGESSVFVASDGIEETLSPVDQVVIAVGLKPREDLKEFLRQKGIRHFVVGDAANPRRIIEATEEGAKAAWSL